MTLVKWQRRVPLACRRMGGKGPRLSLRALLLRDGIETYEKIRILGREIPELKAFTVERGREKGVHADDVRKLNAAVNAF